MPMQVDRLLLFINNLYFKRNEIVENNSMRDAFTSQ